MSNAKSQSARIIIGDINKYRALTLLCNNREYEEEYLIGIYDKFFKGNVDDKILYKLPKSGNIFGWRRYCNGKIIEEEKYSLLSKNGMYEFNEHPGWMGSSNIPNYLILIGARIIYYGEKDDERKYEKDLPGFSFVDKF